MFIKNAIALDIINGVDAPSGMPTNGSGIENISNLPMPIIFGAIIIVFGLICAIIGKVINRKKPNDNNQDDENTEDK